MVGGGQGGVEGGQTRLEGRQVGRHVGRMNRVGLAPGKRYKIIYIINSNFCMLGQNVFEETL